MNRAVAAFCLSAGLGGCTPYPQGTWSGSFVADDGTESAVRVHTGDRDHRSPYAYERERWRVWEARGRVAGWYRFTGVLMECVDGPCLVNVSLIDERLVAEHHLDSFPWLPQGGIAIFGDPPPKVLREECRERSFGGRSWPVWFVLEGDGDPDALHGEGRMGDGCVQWSGPSEPVEGEVRLRR